jgi:hypothetical protein
MQQVQPDRASGETGGVVEQEVLRTVNAQEKRA